MDVELTELTDLDVQRQDAVANPASGFRFLVTKAAGKPPKDDDGDTDGDGSDDDEENAENAAKSIAYLAVETFVYKREVREEERKRLAAEGKALPDGSYPIENEEDLHNAAHLAESGHGDVEAAKRLIARRAKELGVANPLDDKTDAKKGAEGAPETSESEVTKTEGAAEDALTAESVQSMIKAALAERESEAEKRVEALKSELDKLKATPIPGGPVIAATAEQRVVKAKSEAMSKAAYHKRQAELTNDRELIAYHVAKATQFEAEAA